MPPEKFLRMTRLNKVPYTIPMPNNMGMVRYILAFSVVIAHFSEFTEAGFSFPISSYTAVGGFFALSGFLVYGSFLKRPHPGQYIRSRGRRLLPAYWATVLLSALLLVGVSTCTVAQYFGSAQFWKYLGSNMLFLNFIEPELPGVFTSNAVHAVNGSLWTMKIEWLLYFSVPIVAWICRKFKRGDVYVFAAVYLISAIYRVVFYQLYLNTGSLTWHLLSRQFFGQLMYFYTGVICYYCFDLLMRHRLLMLAASLITVATVPFIPVLEQIVHPLAVGVLVIVISMSGRWGTWEGKHDNFSYNIYLTHAPLIQTVVSLGLIESCGLWTGFIIAVALIMLVSWLINRFIERPFQRR